ncbi:MAG: FG-GAP-like repeat-containing protein [Chitinophagales bacterium]
MITLDSISGVLGVADLDGDNLKDIFTWSFVGKNWYKNEGNGNFSTKVSLEDLTLYNYVKIIDFDLDNDFDVLTYNSSTSKLYKNDGVANFVEYENFEFPRILNFTMHDLDDDNDLDLVFANYGPDQVGFFENNGQDKFIVKKVITSSTYNIQAVHALDVNNDGLMDVITSAENQLSWFENLGLNYYSQQQFVTESISLASSIYSNDFDNDGIIDLVCNNYNGALSWYKNDGEGNFTNRLVSNIQNSRSIYTADLDNDGDIDIVASFDDKLRWFENDSDGNFMSHDIESTLFLSVRSITTADLNNDGFLDIIASTGSNFDGVVWLENNGNGGFNQEHIFGELFNSSLAVTAGDFDGDNDIDIVAIHERQIVYYKNSNNGNFDSFWILYTATVGTLSLGSIYSTDLDNDGDLDLVTATYADNTVAWFQNNGNGTFSSQKIIKDNFSKANSIYAEDLDNDGDKDLICAASGDHKSVWFENELPNCNTPIRKKIIDSFEEGTTYQLTQDSSTTVAGQYVFTYQSYYGCDSIVTFYLSTYIVSSLNNSQENSFGLQIAPNPFNDYTVIQFEETPSYIYDFKLFDLQGKYIKGYYGLVGVNFRLDKDELPTGMYFLNLYKNREEHKLIVKNKFCKAIS